MHRGENKYMTLEGSRAMLCQGHNIDFGLKLIQDLPFFMKRNLAEMCVFVW